MSWWEMSLAHAQHIDTPAVAYHQQMEQAWPKDAVPDALKRKLAEVANRIAATPLSCFRYLDDAAYLTSLEALVERIPKQCRDLVLIGTGGSTLGTKAMAQTASAPDMRIHYLENSDPDTADRLLSTLKPETTYLLIISKSGGTIEIITHALIWLNHLQGALGDSLSQHVTVITQPGDTPLRQMAAHFGLETILEHDPQIGGRYSVFSNVGLLPIAATGLDIRAFCEGAQRVLDHFLRDPAGSCPAQGALVQTLHMQQGRAIHVLMPYGDRLQTFSYWYRQLVSESLGKQGKGVTPLTALGAIDQHSMLQLFLDGPPDKWFTLIVRDASGMGPEIPAEGRPAGHEYIAGKHMGDIIQSAQYGTMQSLIRNELPVRVLQLPSFDEASVGALMAHFVLETVITAALIDVNPYDQPAVEDGKVFSRHYLEQDR